MRHIPAPAIPITAPVIPAEASDVIPAEASDVIPAKAGVHVYPDAALAVPASPGQLGPLTETA